MQLNENQYSDDSSGLAATGPLYEACSPIAITYQSSGNAPDVDLKAPKYDKAKADKRR